MSFWKLSDDEDVTKTTGEFDGGGGFLEPLPNDTTVMAALDEAKWDCYKEESRFISRFISLRWSVLAPSEYANRKIFQKLWVLDDKPGNKDPEKYRDKAKKMLAAIDANAGGKLIQLDTFPEDEDLAKNLMNKPMIVKVMQWKIKDEATGEDRIGNWIAAVAPKSKGGVTVPTAKAVGPAVRSGKPATGPTVKKSAPVNDEIPF